MSLLAKSGLSIAFLLVGIATVVFMLTLMGKTDRKANPAVLRRLHKIFGAVFLILLLIISYYCLRYVRMVGEALSVRAVIHGVLALTLFAVLILKIGIVQFYKGFMGLVPAMGMIVLVLAFLVVATSAGYFFLGPGKDYGTSTNEVSGETALSADAQEGKAIFDTECSFCHYANRTDAMMGPGLKGVFRGEKLPVSQRPATPENVRKQLIDPFEDMPSYKSTLSEQEIEHLLEYLETL